MTNDRGHHLRKALDDLDLEHQGDGAQCCSCGVLYALEDHEPHCPLAILRALVDAVTHWEQAYRVGLQGWLYEDAEYKDYTDAEYKDAEEALLRIARGEAT